MYKYALSIATIVVLLFSSCQNGEKTTYAWIETEFGSMKVELYNSTPKHRDNFIKLAEAGFYDDLLFHRVIPGFMIQGGDPDSKNAAPGVPLGSGGPGYRIDAEIGAPHFKGVLAAARTSAGNPEKKSSGSQFYIVEGAPVSEPMLKATARQKGIKYSDVQVQKYVEMGGTPQLDMDYTVFGEVVEGLDIIGKIAAVPRNPSDRPNQDVKMKVRIID